MSPGRLHGGGNRVHGNKAFPNYANDYSHISDPNLRRRLALSEIDKVPFGLYHVRAVLVAGVGFLLDSYDIFAINLIITFLGVVFWQGSSQVNGFGGNNGTLPTSVSQALKVSTSGGIVVGQILFGWLADVFGRRKMYGIELGIILLSTLNCALANPSQSMSSTGLLVFFRVMMVSEHMITIGNWASSATDAAIGNWHRWGLPSVSYYYVRVSWASSFVMPKRRF